MDEEAERLVAALNHLMDGETVVPALVAIGERAIPPLRRFLLAGRPSTVYHPRRWAVQALGELGAREVLMEYLANLEPAADPQIRFAEEVVENAAYREFVRWPSKATVEFLLELSRSRMRTGLVEVLGKLRVLEAIPYFDRALEDDLCRSAAEQALVAIGSPARNALILSAGIRLPAGKVESPSSLRRRRSVLRVLVAMGIEPEDWTHLRSLLDETDPEIVTLVASLAAQVGSIGDQTALIEKLIGVSGHAPWFLLDEIAGCLLAWWDAARLPVEKEIRRRMGAPERERVTDQCLRLLLRVSRRASQARASAPGVNPAS